MPEELDIYSEFERVELKFNGETIGYLSVKKDGTATIEFTKFIEEYSNINGTFEIWTQLKEETVITENREVIITPIEGKEAITIPIDFNPGWPAVEKLRSSKWFYNAEEIEWTIDFNKTLETIRNAKVIDPIQKGQVLREDSIKLYHLETKLNGEATLGDEVELQHIQLGKRRMGKTSRLNLIKISIQPIV